MTTLTVSAPTNSATSLRRLAALETRRYARHPLFVLGVLITIVSCLARPDRQSAAYSDTIVPAAALGVLGLIAMAMMTRASRTLSRAAGAAPVPERTQSAALALACLLPFSVGIVWVAWALWAAHQYPAPANGFPFDHQSTSWKFAVLFGPGAVASLGGPLLGIAIGRWFPQRGAAPLSAVALVAAVIVMQGLFVPLRRVRVVMPWTSWGGPFGIDADRNRMLVLTGSPQWWVVYFACLCALTTVAALWHDPEARTPRLRIVARCSSWSPWSLACWRCSPDLITPS